MKFLLDGDLYLAILSPEGELTPPTSGLNKSTLESLHIVFPIYNQNEIKQISKEMVTCHNKLEPITSRFFPLIYQPEIITILTSKSDFILEYYTYISYYVLTTFLSWEMNYTPTKDPIYSVPLLESILEICCPKGVVINQKIYIMGISAFYMVFSKVAKQSNFSLFAPFFEPLQVYFISLPELPDESIKLLALALEQLSNYSNFQITTDIIPLLNIISKYIYEFPGEISHAILDQVISPLEYQISKLSYEGLNFLSLIANRIPDDVLLRLFAFFTNSLTSFISSTKFKFPQPIDEIREDLPTMPVKEATYRVESKKTFLNGIKFQNPPNFPDKLELKTILTKDLFIRLSLIVKSCSHSESVSKLLINNIELILINSKDQPFYLGLTATYLYLCKHLNKYLDRPTMISILLSKPYFDPNITVFDNLKDFESIDTMRYSILELVVKEGFDAINVAIQTWILQPPLFAEIILRINRLLTVEMFNPKTTIQFSKTLMAISLYYQQMNFTTDSPYVETARKAIFMLITRILEYQELQKLFYNCSIFNTFFFSFIFEEPLRPFILSNFLQFLTTNFANDVIVSSIAQIFDICCSYIDQEDYQIIATSILQVLNDSLIHNSQNVQPFSLFSGPILASLPRLKVTDSSQTLMLNFLHFLTLISNKISSPQVLSLNSTLNRVFADDFPNLLQQKLLQFIAGEPLTSMKPNFIIGQPKILQIYLDFSINKSDDPIKCMHYIYDLLNASMSNTIVCHETNFDLSLLELINKMAGNEEKSELVTLLMDIFCKIAIESSSVNIVHKFVSFMSPINGRYLPNNQELYLKSLNVLLIDELKKPSGYLSYITKDDYLEINGVTGEMINDDFTASCWIFIDNAVAQYKPILFSIVDSKDRRLFWFISGGNLFCTQRNITEESTGHLEIKLPLMSWIFVTFTHKNNKDGSQVKVSFNMVESKTMDFNLMSFEKGPLKITYGGFANEPFQTRQNVKICSLSFHSPSLNIAEIQNIYNGGLLYTTFDTNKTLFSYVLKSSGIKLNAIQKYVSKPSISINVNCTETILPQSFASCLNNYCKPEILLPLFAQFDMTFVNLTKMSNLPKLVIECLSNCLFLSNETQEDFHNSNGFSVISHLLNNLSREHITYQLYTQFFGLLQSLNSQELQFDIISEILLNVPLWMKSDYENHIKILRHWGRSLFPSFKNLIQSKIPIRTFFSMLRLYYFYEQSENIEYSVPRFDSKRENINECRQTILMSLIDMAIDTFCYKDLQLFISHCLTIVETEQVIDLLEFFEELSKKSPLTIKKINIDCCSFLFSLIQRNTDNMMRRVISLLITLSQNNILIYPLDSIFQVFLAKLTPNYVNSALFEFIITKVKFGIHELFPVLVWMSLVLGINSTKRIFSEVKPFKDFTTHLYWSVWPIISLYHYNDSDLNSMIYEFISKCSINNISVLFCMISIVGHCLMVDSSEIKSNFLTNVAQMMTSDRKLSKADISSFFNVTKFFLFYRSNKEKNKTLQRLYRESDFFSMDNFVISDSSQRLKMKQSMSLNNLSHNFVSQQIPLEKLAKNRSSENLIHNSSPLIIYGDDDQTDQSLLENTFQNKTSGKQSPKINSEDEEKVTEHNSDNKFVKILTQNEVNLTEKETPGDEIPITENITSIDDGKHNFVNDDKVKSSSTPLSFSFKKISSNSSSENITESLLPMNLSSENFIMSEDENHVKEVILKPYYLIDRIMKMPNLPDKYYFGLRLDENSNWLDYIFALFCLSLFHRFDSRSFFDVDLLISSYLLYSQPDVVIDHLDALKLTKEEKNDHITFISLINHHAKRLGYGDIIDVNKWSEEDAYLCLQRQQFLMDDNMVSMMNFVFKKLQKSYEDISFEMLKIFTFPSDELVTESIDYLNKYFQEEKEKSHRNYHKWSYLWRNLAGELAPWNCNPNEKIYYKRDQTSCVSFCPFKLKRNYKHNQHIDASLARDTGSRISGAEMAEMEKQKRLQMYSNDMPIDLLVINNVHDKNNTIGNHNLTTETFQISLISPKKVKNGFLKITANSIVMQIQNSYKIILGEEIEHLFFRRRFHRPNSIEIFTVFGKNYFIHFPKHNSLSIISKIQSTMNLPHIKTLQTKDFYSYFKTLSMTELWQNRLLSTFDYLMSLNILSGRTFNDLSQYPVFPWITANHLSDTIEITDKNFFRDFSKPIGALTEERLKEILKRVPDLALVGEKPYMYGNGYSCMLTVCLFMLRTEPFTSLHIDLQSGRFDHASRIFSSIESTWEMISSHISDYRESIPEFFFFPEFLMNLNEFDLGKNKRGQINDVDLPKWSKNAYEFVYLNRKILESEYVSQHINEWIDLIWGYNSRGENAVKHHNVFKQEMYDSAWNEKTLNNPRQRSEIEATLCHVGQMCPQLFFHPHPLRNTKSKYKKFERNINVNLTNMNIVLARINAENDLIKVSMTESKGKTFVYYFDLSQENFNEKTDVTFLNKEIKNFEILNYDGLQKQSQYTAITHEKIACISNTNRRLYIVNLKNYTIEKFEEISNEVHSVCASVDEFSVATSSSSVVVFRNFKKVCTCMSYREGISCCFSSSSFHISVIGTRDGFILINSIPSGELVRSIDMKDYRPQSILITPGWGFILVYSTKIVDYKVKYCLQLFNINGGFLRERELDSPITYMQTFTSRDGFDYILISDDKNRVYLFEAFYLEISEPVTRFTSHICALRFFKDFDCLCIVGIDGKVSFISCKIPNVL